MFSGSIVEIQVKGVKGVRDEGRVVYELEMFQIFIGSNMHLLQKNFFYKYMYICKPKIFGDFA